jgi:pentatricopeptide repeat protein
MYCGRREQSTNFVWRGHPIDAKQQDTNKNGRAAFSYSDARKLRLIEKPYDRPPELRWSDDRLGRHSTARPRLRTLTRSATFDHEERYHELFRYFFKSAKRHGTDRSDQILKNFDEMRRLGFTPHPDLFDLAIQICEKEGYADRAEQVFKLMASFKIEPECVHYNRLINVYANRDYPSQQDADRVLELWREMHAKGVRPDDFTFCAVIRILGKTGRADEVGPFFDGLLKDYPGVVNQFCYRAAIAAFGSQHKPDAAQRVFDMMTEQAHIEPDIATINALIHAYGNTNQPEEALSLLRKWATRDGARFRLAPNAITVGWLVKAFSWKAPLVKEPDGPRRALPASVDYAVPYDTPQHAGPVAATPGPVRRDFDLRRVKNAERLMRDLEREFGVTSAMAYSHLIGDYMAHGDEESAMRLIKEGCDKGVFCSDISNPALDHNGKLSKLDFHQRAVFRVDDSTRAKIKQGSGVAPLLAIALIQYHRMHERIDGRTTYIVGQHGSDELRKSVLNHLNIGHEPVHYMFDARNPGLIAKKRDCG